jgi:hypothetical protein
LSSRLGTLLARSPSFGGSAAVAEATSPPSPFHAAAAAGPSGIGLLASFGAESPASMCLLRTYRAGRRPIAMRQGWLLKRKRTAWRESAPLGPLAWKRRWFVLETDRMTYYKASGGRAEAKGVISLAGWVEVARVGADAQGEAALLSSRPEHTTRAHAFVVRTGRTAHVFQASSEAEAAEWVEAIAINAQHVGAAQDEPQCLVLPGHRDVETLASAVAQRRRFLVDSGAAESQGGLVVDLSASALGTPEAAAQAVAAAAAADRAAAQVAAEEDAADAAASAAADAAAAASAAAVASAASASSATEAISAAAAAINLSGPLQAELAPALARGNAAAGASAAGALPSPREPSSPSGGGAITLAEAEALVMAMGEASDEFFSQLPINVAVALRERINGASAAAPQPWRPSPPPLPLLPLRAEERFFYLDDAGQPRGPFGETEMRSWLVARYFGPSTLVRPHERVDEGSGFPALFLPLATLFPNPEIAFNGEAGARAWRAAYRAEVAVLESYRELEAAALALGLDAAAVREAVDVMRSTRAAADLGALLDVAEAKRAEREREAARQRETAWRTAL